MRASPRSGNYQFNNQEEAFQKLSLIFTEPTETEDFKQKVCMPYFKDIYKDLCGRSDDKSKGINKISFLDYCQLPGLLGERLFAVMDKDEDSYLNSKEFLTGLLRFYCSTFDQKMKFVFEIYDFDRDGYISKVDITTIISCMPSVRQTKIIGEGKFTQEGGGLQTFNERVDTLEEMFRVLDSCFGNKQRVDLAEFKRLTEEVTSDMVLAVLSLFRERLPCSENYWRYKRNYELHMRLMKGGDSIRRSASPSICKSSGSSGGMAVDEAEECKSEGGDIKQLAQAQMSFVMPLAQYTDKRSDDGESSMKSSSPPMSPGRFNVDNMSISNLKSNNVKEQRFIDLDSKLSGGQMSPGQMSPSNDGGIGLHQVFEGRKQGLSTTESSINLCICGLPALPTSSNCASCEGQNSFHYEGEILKKQKKGGVLKKYWFVLLGKELYSYKSQQELKHKEMKSLSGAYLKEELEEVVDGDSTLYPFMLIFPNKRRIYFLKSQEEKDKWVNAIKKATGYANVNDFYEMGEKLGKGKYGLVRQAKHKTTGAEVAVKIVKKKELSIKDMELLKREIDVLKVCQHPNIIQFHDVFDNQDYIYIVMECLKGGDFFSFLHQRNFNVPEETARSITHQLATSIYYLHSFGIAHRDLKPENILMLDKSDKPEVKIVDFGLSRTFGPGETCREPYGTLCYVAPEILMQQPYDKSVDCWSLGIIIYLLLGRHLPFDSQDDKEIGRKTIYQEISFSHPVWNNVSSEGKDLISKLLVKNRNQRMKIEQVLDHPWLIGNDPTVRAIRRKSADEGNSVMKFVAYSQTDMHKIRASSPKSSHASGFFNEDPPSSSLASALQGKAAAASGGVRPGTFAAKLKAGGGAGGPGGAMGLFKNNNYKNNTQNSKKDEDAVMRD